MGWHHFWNPHCEHCREEKVCLSCETLRSQLEIITSEKNRLLTAVLHQKEPPPIDITKEKLPQPIPPRNVSWKIRKEMLEDEDRKKSELLKAHDNETKELERELGVENG